MIFQSKPYRKHQSEPNGDTDARRKREAKAHTVKRQAESTQEADARKKRVAKAQATKRLAESTLEADARRKKLCRVGEHQHHWHINVHSDENFHM